MKDLRKMPGVLGSLLRRPVFSVDGYSLMELIVVMLLASVAVPGLVSMYTTVMAKTNTSELITIADYLAREQMEIILADKAGSGAGYGYANINSSRYSSVDPSGYFASFTRTVTITTRNPGHIYEFKEISVTVSHSNMPTVVLTGGVFDHPGL